MLDFFDKNERCQGKTEKNLVKIDQVRNIYIFSEPKKIN